MNQIERPHPASPLLDHCPPSMPARAYYDPQWFAEEQKAIWSRHWIYAGRVADLAPSVLRRIEITGQNLVIVRNREGTITAFHNVCRHRGAELCTVPERVLNAQLISCPYHQWRYDLGGRLVRTPFVSSTDDFDKADHSLFPVQVRFWNGLIFLSLADNPPDFDLAPDLGPNALDSWPMEQLVTGHTMVKEIACNWKIFWENYNECLHCPGIHPELSAAVPVYSRGYMAPNEAPGWTPELPTEPVLNHGRQTWTMNGRACGPEFEGLTSAERAAGQTFVTLLPTMFIVAHVDYVRLVSLRPLGPERTELKAEWLFSAETLANPDFDLANVVDFATLVMSQDGDACEMNQRGLKSTRFEHGILMPQEFDVYRFQNWIRDAMSKTTNQEEARP